MATPPRRKSKKSRRPAPKSTFLQRWRANFLTGLVVVAPVTLTLYLLWNFITFVDSKIVPLVPEFSARFPDVRVDVQFSDRMLDIIEEGIDVALVGP